MALTDQQFALLQRSIDAIMERIAELGLSLEVEQDLSGLTEFLAQHDAFINQTFDPSRLPIRGESFWFRLTDMYGRTVASHADRIYQTDDFFDLIATGELWYVGGCPELAWPGVKVLRPPVRIGGTVGHSGSMWVEPAFRGKGLSIYLPYLSRSLCLRNFATDFHTGVVLSGLRGTRVPGANYGYPHVELCLQGYCPPTRKQEDLYLCWMTQAEALERLRQLPQHKEFPVEFALGSDRKVGEHAIAGANYQHVDLAPVLRQR